MNQSGAGAGPEANLRTMRILWAVFLMVIGIFFLVTRFARPDDETVAESSGNTTILPVLAIPALLTVVASFVLKAHFFKRAAEQQHPMLLQQGLIIALALCEAAVLLGLVGVFITWNDYAYLLFVLGGIGEALHFPRREQVMSAYFKPGM